MTSLGRRWFHRPRICISTPSRAALLEFMNNFSFQPPNTQQRPQLRNTHSTSYTFPPQRPPIVVTSSFYNREYPFDDTAEEPERLGSSLINPPPQYDSIYQQEASETITQPTLLQQEFIPNDSDVILSEEDNEYYSPSIQHSSLEASSSSSSARLYKKIRSIKRKPTPFASSNHQIIDTEEEELDQDSHENDPSPQPNDVAGFEKLKDDFKQLKKKHEELQQYVYFMSSRSYDSSYYYSSLPTSQTAEDNYYYPQSNEYYANYYMYPSYNNRRHSAYDTDYGTEPDNEQEGYYMQRYYH